MIDSWMQVRNFDQATHGLLAAFPGLLWTTTEPHQANPSPKEYETRLTLRTTSSLSPALFKAVDECVTQATKSSNQTLS
eukprot:9631895-Alexandrium_andersonii.AAC.1